MTVTVRVFVLVVDALMESELVKVPLVVRDRVRVNDCNVRVFVDEPDDVAASEGEAESDADSESVPESVSVSVSVRVSVTDLDSVGVRVPAA